MLLSSTYAPSNTPFISRYTSVHNDVNNVYYCIWIYASFHMLIILHDKKTLAVTIQISTVEIVNNTTHTSRQPEPLLLFPEPPEQHIGLLIPRIVLYAEVNISGIISSGAMAKKLGSLVVVSVDRSFFKAS